MLISHQFISLYKPFYELFFLSHSPPNLRKILSVSNVYFRGWEIIPYRNKLVQHFRKSIIIVCDSKQRVKFYGEKKTLNRYDIPFGLRRKSREDYEILVAVRGISDSLNEALMNLRDRINSHKNVNFNF